MSNQAAKRNKGKKAADPVNTTKQIEDTIALLERSQAGEKDQEIEIGGSCCFSVPASAMEGM